MRTMAEKQRIMDSLVGTPYQLLPGFRYVNPGIKDGLTDPPTHKVVGELSDGTKIRAAAVMMVWNDAWLMDQIEGEGTYESTVSGRQLEVLKLARQLYAKGAE